MIVNISLHIIDGRIGPVIPVIYIGCKLGFGSGSSITEYEPLDCAKFAKMQWPMGNLMTGLRHIYGTKYDSSELWQQLQIMCRRIH